MNFRLLRSKVPCLFLFFSLLYSCTQNKEIRAAKLYETYCSSCHILPDIKDLPKNIWAEGVLPEMAARMGITYEGSDPYKGLSFQEQEARMKSGVYPSQPIIPKKDWDDLRTYILSIAPDSLTTNKTKQAPKELIQFQPTELGLDQRKGTFITFLAYDEKNNSMVTANLNGSVKKIVSEPDSVIHVWQTEKAVTSYIEKLLNGINNTNIWINNAKFKSNQGCSSAFRVER